MALETEAAFFREHRSEWLAGGHEGEWAVVHGTEHLGFFPTVQAGFNAGLAKWGAVIFLVKKITPDDRVEKVTRVGLHAGDRLSGC